MVYARVVFQTNASAAERHDDVGSARRWIEEERCARPKAFRLGEIYEGAPDLEVLATCDSKGWHSLQREDGEHLRTDLPAQCGSAVSGAGVHVDRKN